MAKTETEQSFDYLVSKVILPLLKNKGYKKQGNNFKFFDNTGWGKIVNFQKSQWGSKDDISFTINIGLYLPEAEKFHCNKEAKEKFVEPSSVVRKRIGKLIPNNKTDLWFDLNLNTDKKYLYREIKNYFESFVVPYLDSIQSKQDILNLLVNGHKSDYMAAQILTLYKNGYKDVARQQLKEELLKAEKGLPTYLEWLKKAEQQMVD